MSDQDKNEEHAAPSSPAPMDTPTKGRGRGRGKGRGKRKPIAKPKVTTAVKKPIPTGRRGRIKQYNDPLVQAAYERQREVKTAYLSIISHVKPALEELASRNIDKLKKDSAAHKTVPEYRAIKGQLDARLAKVVDNAKEVLETKLDLIKRSHGKYAEFQELQYQVGASSLFVLNFPCPLALNARVWVTTASSAVFFNNTGIHSPVTVASLLLSLPLPVC